MTSRVGGLGVLLVTLVFPMVGNGRTGAPTWPERLFNPKPTPEDLVLPLPCGGAMAFRAVTVPSNGWLDDKQVELGMSDPRRGFIEGRRTDHIAGAFTDPEAPNRRYYFIAKYETTRDQFASVVEHACPTPGDEGLLPKVDVSWFDAVDFSRRYTEWLLQNARKQLPNEGGQPGFLRLPTEVEWEFAARGGTAVASSDFVATVFPMKGDLNQYVWHQSTQSSQGQLQAVGLLDPNPLGLHDVLGNAAEMAFVPFQLDRRGRLHGQAGGFVIRGGSVLTSGPWIRTALREELPYFDADTGKAKSRADVGFRLALTAPVIVSHERLRSIREEWTHLTDQPGDAGVATERAMSSLGTAASQAADAKLRADLELAQRNLESAHTQLNENRDRAIRAFIRSGAYLGLKVMTDDKRIRGIESAIALARQDVDELRRRGNLGNAQDHLEDMDATRRRAKMGLDYTLSYYSDLVVQLSSDYPFNLIEPQLGVLLAESEAKQSDFMRYYADRLAYYARLFVAHIRAYNSTGKPDRSQWFDDIQKGGEGT